MQARNFIIDPLEPRQLFASLTPAQTYLTSISSPGVQKNWTIPIVAGQNITLAASDRSGGALETELILISPSGKTLRRSIGDKGAFMSYNAPVGGNYRVRLRDFGANNTGSVGVTAFYYASTITDSDDAFSAQSGRRFAATIEPGDLDVWTLSASQAQFLSVTATENKAGDVLDIGVLLIGPNGAVVSGKESEKGIKLDVAGSSAGTYYAVVYEPGADNTGRYGISFARAPGTQYSGDPDTATPLPPSTTRSGDLPGGDMDVFGIPISAGQRISATVTRTIGSLSPEMLLVDPTGRVVSTVDGSTTATLNYTATSGGTFWLVARDRESDNGGQYTIRYTFS